MNNQIFYQPASEFVRCEFSKLVFREWGEFTSSVIGKTVSGKEIEAFSFGTGKRKILILGAYHGAEYITASVLYLIMKKIRENLTRGAKCFSIEPELFKQIFTFWIVPCANPDGVDINLLGASGHPLEERLIRMNGGRDFALWQANALGVDLNHNHAYRFDEYKKIEREGNVVNGRTLYSGEYPESEPETHAVANLVRVLMPDLIISLHTQGEEIFARPATPKTAKIAARIAKSVSFEYKNAEGTAAYGGLCDYTGEVLGILSLTVELGRGKNPLPFDCLPVLSEKTYALISAALPFIC